VVGVGQLCHRPGEGAQRVAGFECLSGVVPAEVSGGAEDGDRQTLVRRLGFVVHERTFT
jgi:hypothetical protein